VVVVVVVVGGVGVYLCECVGACPVLPFTDTDRYNEKIA
jgi:hypothetical protein